MHKCEECKSLFEEDEIIEIQEEVGECCGVPAYETVRICPKCKSEDIVEIERCPICDRYDHEYYEKYCDECKRDITEKMKDLVKENFKPEEIELIKELFEGEWE